MRWCSPQSPTTVDVDVHFGVRYRLNMSTADDVPKDDDAPTAEEIEQYSNYVKAANACVRDGPESPDCDKARILEAAAVAYGADPALVDSLHACFQNPDTEECAKALAKVAAIAACTAVTEGAGGYLCTLAAPIVVDIVWPTVSPIVMPVWHWASSLTAYTNDVILDIGKTIGIDLSTDAPPTVTDAYWRIKDPIQQQLKDAYIQSVEALAVAQDSAEKELGLPRQSLGTLTRTGELSVDNGGFNIPLPNKGGFNIPLPNTGDTPESGVDAALRRAALVSELEHWLALEPAWVDEITITQTKVDEHTGKQVRRFVTFPKRPADETSSFRTGWKDFAARTVWWTPSHFAYFTDGWSWGNDQSALADCAATGMARRAQGLKQATAKAIGSVVQKQTMRAEVRKLNELRGASDSSSTLLLVVATAAVAIGGGIWLWKKH